MAEQSSVNLDITNNTDGFDVTGGTTPRKLTVSGADIAVTGSGSATYTYPGASCTIAKASPVQTDVTGSRVINTTYTNGDANRSILVIATVRCQTSAGAGTAYVQAKSDTATPPTTAASGIVGIQSGLAGEDNSFAIMFVVAAGTDKTYRIDGTTSSGTLTLSKWMEVVF